MLIEFQELFKDTEMLSAINRLPFKKLNPSGAPLLPNLLRYQSLAVCYTATRLMPYLRQKRRLQILGSRCFANLGLKIHYQFLAHFEDLLMRSFEIGH